MTGTTRLSAAIGADRFLREITTSDIYVADLQRP
jgi:hypothetical protein